MRSLVHIMTQTYRVIRPTHLGGLGSTETDRSMPLLFWFGAGLEVISVRSKAERFLDPISFVLSTQNDNWKHTFSYQIWFFWHFCFIFGDPLFLLFFRTTTRGGTKTLHAQKETPEMDVSERDSNPVKISASNSKNSRSYSIFAKVDFFLLLST